MPSIGETLRDARVKKGVSPEVAARALKIKIERLHDLEENRYDQFAAHVYIRGFLRLYAEYLGLDSAPLIQQFSEENPPPSPKPVFEITEEQRARSPVQRHVPTSSSGDSLTTTGKTVLVATVVILFLIVASVWWLLHTEIRRAHASAEAQDAPGAVPAAAVEEPPPSLPPQPIVPTATATNFPSASHRTP